MIQVPKPGRTCGQRRQGFDTRALHAGFHPLKDMEQFRSFVPPIVQSMTYPYETFDKFPDYIYGRSKTPTVSVLEERLAALEGGEGCVTAGSGSQALFNLIFTIARPGDNVVTTLNTFGEGYKQAATIFPERCNVEFRFVKNSPNPDAWDQAIDQTHETGLGGDAQQSCTASHRCGCRCGSSARARSPLAGR